MSALAGIAFGVALIVAGTHIAMWLRWREVRRIVKLAANAVRIVPYLMDADGWRCFQLADGRCLEVSHHFVVVGSAEPRPHYASCHFGVADGPLDRHSSFWAGPSLVRWMRSTPYHRIVKALAS